MANAWALRPERIVDASATSTAPGHAPVNVANDHMGVVWKSNGGADFQSITVILDTHRVMDTVMVFGASGATANWTLKFDVLADDMVTIIGGGAYTSGVIPFLAGAAMPTHGRGVAMWEVSFAPAALRVYRLTIGGLAGAPATIGRIAIGTRLRLDRNFAFGAGFGVRDFGSLDFSATGAMLRRHGAGLRTVGLTFPGVHRDEVEARVQLLIELQRGTRPIALVTDPAPHPQRQTRCYFGPMTGELGTVWRTAGGHEWRASLTDLVPLPA